MPRLTQVLSAITLALGVSTTQGMFRFDCFNNLVVDRVDPIINPGTEGGHVHIISGGNAFSKDAKDLTKSTCTSCPIGADLSAYWTPALYVKYKNGTGYGRVKSNQIVYYQPRGDKTEKIYALPPGLKMVAGDVTLKAYNETDIKQRAVTWVCLNFANPQKEGPIIPDGVHCPDGLRGQVNFPMCWDGKNLDSEDHKSHMAYAEGLDGGKCPPSHPKKVIKVFFEMFYHVKEWDSEWVGDKHPFTLSNGDRTGYSFHGDFFGGWDEEVLQRATDECRDKNYFNSGECPPLAPTFSDKPPAQRCTLQPEIKEEVDSVKELPGMNMPMPLPSAGPAPAPGTSVAPSAAPTTAPGTSVAPSTAPSAAPGTSAAPSKAPTNPSSAPGTKTPKPSRTRHTRSPKPTTPAPSKEVGGDADGDYDEDDDSEVGNDASASPSTLPSKCKAKTN
ncbi:hypothetical protein Poli38472_013432 [Pythium oligandrum]|uniref:DUF1996 domain-containing protein n=1 Tax=Pythium oligandrum TaxID=41045 RepID=A0A8K1FGP1_PYTOL|nr:hypothetical protein Poli38472_013432 [Pythium oligandrum]|eukprot:TMW57958.1 hypothetical protein Poli38472_013432 [Pythium oligandrum]